LDNKKINHNSELSQLCGSVRALIKDGNYAECTRSIRDAMRDYPHAAHPHNLMGIVLEEQGDLLAAMKHFRAAWALDPTYLPCRINLNRYGSFFAQGVPAFDETDCLLEDKRRS
jgi:Flp pilus assembly protein TadD